MTRRLALPLAILASVLAVGGFIQLTRSPSLRFPVSTSSEITKLGQILHEQNLSVSTPLSLSGSTAVASVSGLTVLFSLEKDLNGQVRTLQLVLPKVKIEGKTPKEIDLRYNKVVVRY